MLKITVLEDQAAITLVLEGTLTQPYVSELEKTWKGTLRSMPAVPCTVDLRNTTFIDESGEKTLLDIKRSGARFVACGVATTHQLERLGIECTGRSPGHTGTGR